MQSLVVEDQSGPFTRLGVFLEERRISGLRLYKDGETGDVSGSESTGESVGDSGERGNETGRYDHRPHAERNERGYGEGSSQSGDLSVEPVSVEKSEENLTSEEGNEPILREVVEELVDQKSTESPVGSNFVIGDSSLCSE